MGVGALFLALTLVGKTGASYDAEAARLSARGAAAADLRAPSAQVARVKAERAARKQAEGKIAAAVAALAREPAAPAAPDELAKVLAAGAVSDEDFGSDGSVELTLTISTESLGLKRKR